MMLLCCYDAVAAVVAVDDAVVAAVGVYVVVWQFLLSWLAYHSTRLAIIDPIYSICWLMVIISLRQVGRYDVVYCCLLLLLLLLLS